MKYNKQSTIGGAWLRAAELTNGTRAKLVSESKPVEGGQYGTQDVAKIRLEGNQELKNVSLNKTTINAFIDAFGDDSKNWIDKVLTVHTEKMVVSGRRTTALYLIPEGYELSEDEGGYLVIKRKENKVEPPENEINPDEVPF